MQTMLRCPKIQGAVFQSAIIFIKLVLLRRRTSLNLCLSGLAGASISAPAAAAASAIS